MKRVGRRSLRHWRARGAGIRHAGAGAIDQVETQWAATNQRLTRCWDRLLPWPVASVQPWRLVVGGLAVLIPSLMLAALNPALPVTTPGVVLLVAVAFSTYLADWVGGAAALFLSVTVLDLLFVGDRRQIDLPKDAAEAMGFVITLASGAALIWLIERIKREGADQRLAAVAARAAANALASLEQVAASGGRGDERDQRRLSRAIVNAMVRVNRAHAGALLLVTPDRDNLEPSDSYGFADREERALQLLSVHHGLAGLIARERRPCLVEDVRSDARLADSPLLQTKLRALLGVPVVGRDDQLLGIAVIGLLVRHRFTPTEVARMEALAERASTRLQAAAAADEREMLLLRAREAERRMELVMAAMPETVVIAAPPDGRVIGYNSAAEALFGPLGDPDGVNDIAPHLRPPSGDETEGTETAMPHMMALQTGEVVDGIELVVMREDGLTTPVLASAAPIREPDGALAAVVTVFRDIAPLKEAARLKDEFVSVVSHELRSPLTPIRGFVQLVAKDLDRAGDHDTHVRWLTSIEGQIDRMTRLVDDLLDVSRLRAGGLEIRRAPVDLVALGRSIVDVRTASATNHRLVLTAAVETAWGNWDADRLHQVVENLVGNAIKYSPEGGTITLTIGVDDATGDAVVTVADEGPGIAPENRPQIFGAFFRAREAAESQIGGLGLGLYICHELVVAHGGTISVGEAPGGGAAFTVRLPRGEVTGGEQAAPWNDVPAVTLLPPIEPVQLSICAETG
jgi:signal transduction histidine kinase